jgi:hypothetical protein
MIKVHDMLRREFALLPGLSLVSRRAITAARTTSAITSGR